MPVRIILCPQCGAENDVVMDDDSFVCDNCGAILGVDEKDFAYVL